MMIIAIIICRLHVHDDIYYLHVRATCVCKCTGVLLVYGASVQAANKQ